MNVLLIFLFLVIFGAVLLAASLGFKVVEDRRAKKVKRVLATAAAADSGPAETTILIETQGANAVDRAVANLDRAGSLSAMIQQAGLPWSASKLLTAMAIAGVVGALIAIRIPVLLIQPLSSIALGIAFAALPFLYVKFKRNKRMSQFEEQFPEALDFLSRSMRAGHAFSVSLEMMGEESSDPLGQEFRVLFNEQNLGAPLEVALKNMAVRVPLLDTRFFVSAVMLQRQTGGNLSEILTRLAYVIRERFRLKGQVRAASAHGRITAAILSIMPIVVAAAMMVVAPGYLPAMANDPDGKWLLVGAVLGQMLGYYTMKRIINIKV